MKNIIKKSKRFNIISFDIFDTLIKRNVDEPSDVFLLIETCYNQLNKNKIRNFKKNRIEAYEKAYKKKKNDLTLKDIYKELETLYSNIEEIMKLEIDIEMEICVSNYSMLNIYNEIKNNGKRIIIISDMYLPKEIIVKILKKNKILDYEKIYISCECGKSKVDGSLFQQVIEDLNIEPSELLHIGDNIKTDYIRPLSLGIKAVRIKSNKKFKGYISNKEKSIEYNVLRNVIKNNAGYCKTEFERIGLETIGPLLYGFVNWLHRNTKDNKIDKIYFLAREGNIFMNIYSKLFPKEKNIEYLYVSRRSLLVPSYCLNPNFIDIVNSVSKSKRIGIKSLISRWGLKYDEVCDLLHKNGYSDNAIYDGMNLSSNVEVKKIFELLKDKIIDNSKKEYELLKQYLIQKDFCGKCAIVDVGWNGSMQLALTKIIKSISPTSEIHGYYIGINTSNLPANLDNIHGFIYEQSACIDNRYLIYGFAGPLELSLTASHGSTIGYKQNGLNIEPVLNDGEYIFSNGKYKIELEYAMQMQTGANLFCNAMYSNIEINAELAFNNLKMFGLYPKTKHLKMFYEFGANDLGEKQIFVSKKYHHLFGKTNFVRGFWLSTWKFGYMKDICKLPLPYYKLYVKRRKKIN